MTAESDRLVTRWLEASDAVAEAGTDAAWLGALRERARAHLAELGLPHRKLESWRHTSLAALERIDWEAPPDGPAAEDVALPELVLDEGSAHRIVVVDGRVAVAPASSGGASIGRLAEAGRADGDPLLGEIVGQLADTKTEAFTALNTALFSDGPWVEIPKNADVPVPVHVAVTSVTPGRLVTPRLAVVARTGSRATLVVDHVTIGDGPRLTSFVGEITVEDAAEIDLVVLQRERDESFLVSNLRARVARDARLRIHTLTLGGGFVRNDLRVQLADVGAEADMRGLFLGDGTRLVDNHTLVDHAMPHTTSRELYKGVLGAESHGVFCGRVIVRPGAQKTDSGQSNPNLLLTERAEIDTQPQLEIYADDVKCSHGSTVGQLDDDALFYLRSRGIGEAESRVMLTRGFANEIVARLPGEALRERAARLVDEALLATIAGTEGGR